MVRKMIIVCLALAALAAEPLSASAASVYDGTISTTYITVFRDIASKLGPLDEYVFYRSGQYQYTMIAGEITWDGSTFAADEASSYVLDYSSTYNSSYSYDTGTVAGWTLTPGNALVYSSLGDYPDLIERGDKYEMATLFVLCVALCMSLIRPVFNFTLRRSRYSG